MSRLSGARLAVLAILPATALSWQLLASPDLLSRRILPLPYRPSGLTLGDFNEDGRLDLVVAYPQSTYGLDLLVGMGSGRFGAPQTITPTEDLLEVMALDLNEDGHLDLAACGHGTSALTIVLGDGAGGFGAPQGYGASTVAHFMASADFDEDSHADIVISNTGANSIWVFWGTGTGAFEALPRVIALPGSTPNGVAAGDLWTDGHVDIAVAIDSGVVVIVKGSGNRNLGTIQRSVTLGPGLRSIVAADFDDDGIDDLAVADTTAQAIRLVRSIGDGTFAAQGSLSVGAYPYRVAAGDLNRDGRPDLVVSAPQQVSTFIAAGPFAFGSGRSFRAGPWLDELQMADLTEDGLVDILVASTQSSTLELLPGDGQGRLRAETEITLPYLNSPDLVAADFDENGLTDLVVLNHSSIIGTECTGPSGGINCGSSQLVAFLLRTGPAAFGSPASVQTRCFPWAIAAADFDMDGHLDVVTANRGVRDGFGVCYDASLTFLPGNGQGGFGPSQDLLVADEPHAVAVGHFNQDGRPDLVVAFGAARRIQLFLPDAVGVLNPGVGVSLTGEPRSLAVGDLNEDGFDDVAAGTTAGVAILFGAGDGSLTLHAQCAGGDPVSRSVAIGDFDGDGIVDVAAGKQSYYQNPATISLLHRIAGAWCGPGTVESVPFPQGPLNVATGDLDADGFPEILVTALNTAVGVQTGGQPMPDAPSELFGARLADNLATADFNGDGLLDVAASWVSGGGVSILLNATAEATDVSMRLEATTIAWRGVAGAIGYDIVRGDLEILHQTAGDYATSVQACVADNSPVPYLTFDTTPPPGSLWWILARPIGLSGPGSYDSGGPGQIGSRDAELSGAPLACP